MIIGFGELNVIPMEDALFDDNLMIAIVLVILIAQIIFIVHTHWLRMLLLKLTD